MRRFLRLVSFCALGVVPASVSPAARLQAPQPSASGQTTTADTEKTASGNARKKPPYEADGQPQRHSGGTTLRPHKEDTASPHPDQGAAEIEATVVKKPDWDPPSPVASRGTNGDPTPEASGVKTPDTKKEDSQNHDDDRRPVLANPPPRDRERAQASADPLKIAEKVLLGWTGGMCAAAGLIWLRFRTKLPGRPYGDISRGMWQHSYSKAWLAGHLDPTIFQPEIALRDHLISPDELRGLRSRYLASGNFSFSMMLPALLGIYLAAVNVVSEGAPLWPTLLTFSVTTLLCIYALDQRHKFRAEYRLLVRRGWQEARAKRPNTPFEEVLPDEALGENEGQ